MPLILLNKPHRVLSQFRDPDGRDTLAAYVKASSVYPAGRLDYDSEGLLLLTDDGELQSRIADPKYKLPKSYWAQVEGTPDDARLGLLRAGVKLKDGPARAISAVAIDPPEGLWLRTPPIRERKSVPDFWLDVTIAEGRNRQVRRMAAAVGFPCLRLIRHSIGPWQLDDLPPGGSRQINNKEAWRILNAYQRSLA